MPIDPVAAQPTPVVQDRLLTATDDFIKHQLPAWLGRASEGQIKKLHDQFKVHQQRQALLRTATGDVLDLSAFAVRHFQTLLGSSVPAGTTVAGLVWITEHAEILAVVPPAVAATYRYTYEPALSKLMQGFAAGSGYIKGNGLGLQGSHQVLVEGDSTFIERCRQLDVGKRYQDKLDEVFNDNNLAHLAEDKRSGFLLAVEVAALRGTFTARELIALRQVAQHLPDTVDQPLPQGVGLLALLGHTLPNALLVELPAQGRSAEGLLLYLPNDPHQALRRFSSLEDMQRQLVQALRQPDFRQSLLAQVNLKDRAAFMTVLDARLKDRQPDLQLRRSAITADAFMTLARLQVQQVKGDARLVLVPTADIDEAKARLRLQAWAAVGMGLSNVAGLFVPVVGALLLGQFVVQTLSAVFEGVADWSEGHQHEALEHMLRVARSVAVTGATVAGVVALRSAFVDALEPIALGDGRKRLWAYDLRPYEGLPDNPRLQADGLYGLDERRWMRVQSRYYEVHRPDPQGPWRLRHPLRDDAYGPVALHNGQRGWRLMTDRPLEWNDSARMLDCLWPQDPPIDAQRAEQVLYVAGMGRDQLRGLVVENRAAPANLADTLRRFEVDARIDVFISHLERGSVTPGEEHLLNWCRLAVGDGQGEAGLFANIVQQMPLLRWRLFEHFAHAPELGLPMATLVKRDFPGLPKAYIPEVLDGVDDATHELAYRQQRLPLAQATRAQALLRSARLAHAVEGFFLGSSSYSQTDELAIAVLRQLPSLPSGLNLQVRDGTAQGRLLAAVGAEGRVADRILVRDGRLFKVFDGQRQPIQLPGDAPTTIFEAICAVLSPEQAQAMGMRPGDSAVELRHLLCAQLPATREACAEWLGWPVQSGGFNPGQRLADGRVGYPLSGRGAAAAPNPRQTLLEGLRRLFPGLDDNQLNQALERLLQGDDMPFAMLASLQQEHLDLNRSLNLWVSSELRDARRGNRQRLAECLLAAWRGQGERVAQVGDELGGLRMTLGFSELATLPALPEHVVFTHVTLMTISDTALTLVADDFLHGFPHVRALNLSGNRLLSIPPGIARMPGLQSLRLARNLIRLNAAAVEALTRLPGLTRLDLSYNPLGATQFSVSGLAQLLSLSLRHCRLSEWPVHIERCPRLQMVDLRDNQLRHVPPETLNMSQALRQAFLVEGNPLRSQQVMALYALETIDEAGPEMDHAPSRALWLEVLPASQRFEHGLSWDSVAGSRGSSPFFQFLGRLDAVADYAQARAYLGEQVWSLIVALQTDASLRLVVFEQAVEMPALPNRIADTFSRMQLRLLQARAESNYRHYRQVQAHIALGRGLYRLDLLETMARETAEQVNQARALANGRALASGRQPPYEGDIGVAELGLFYRVSLREALSLPGQPQTLHAGEQLGVSEAQVRAVERAIIHWEATEGFVDDLSRRGFWQLYLAHRYPQGFQAIEADNRDRIARFTQGNPRATLQVRAAALQEFALTLEMALHQHRMILTRFELRSAFARQG